MASSIFIGANILLFSAISIIFVAMKALILGATDAIGLMRQYTPIPTEAVAAAMIRLAKSGRQGNEIIVSQDILNIE